MKKVSFTMVVVAIMMVVSLTLSACGATNNQEQVEVSGKKPATKTTYPLTVTDASGTEVTFEQAPKRVVTLLPSETEIMYAIGAGELVVGTDDYSNYPAEAANKPHIGGMETNYEAIIALKPDLILASSTMNTAAIEQLRSLKLTVLATDPKTYDDTIAKIEQIGAIMDKSTEAFAVAQHMKEVKQQVTEAVANATVPNVYLEFSPGYTVGKGEYLDEIITLAGGKNISDQPGWYEVDPEYVIQQNPSVIIYGSMTGEVGANNSILKTMNSRPGWSAIDAMKNKRVYEVDSDSLTRVGPRLADGLLAVARQLHPDRVK